MSENWKDKRNIYFQSTDLYVMKLLLQFKSERFCTNQEEHSLLQSFLGKLVQTSLSYELLQTQDTRQIHCVTLSADFPAPSALCSVSMRSPCQVPLSSLYRSGLSAARSASGNSPAGWDYSGAEWLSQPLPSEPLWENTNDVNPKYFHQCLITI